MFRILNVFLVLTVLALIYPAAVPTQASTCTDNNLLQFTSDGHVLGFAPGGFYVAAGDHALKVEFVNASTALPAAQTAGNGQDAASPLDKVTYMNTWEGVDIVYTSAANGIAESTYYLNTPASVDSIRLRYNRPVSLDSSGNLVIAFENGKMTESAPVAWQEINGTRNIVSAKYVIYGENEAGFALAECRPGVPVIIDPIIAWISILPGSANHVISIALDSSGNIYTGGYSNAGWGSPVRAYYADTQLDVFVAKLNKNGILQWNTFLGGAGHDQGGAIALDPSGNIYVTGESHNSWQGDSAPVRAFTIAISTDNMDVFAAKLNNSGVLQWNTFLGGYGNEWSGNITLDAGGNIYVTGSSNAVWAGDNPPVRDFTAVEDAFAAKLSNNGALQWNTFLGGDSADTGNAISTDSSNNVYVAGISHTTWGSPVRAYLGFSDIFAVKLNNNGVLQWNTFLGGDYTDYCSSMVLDAGGNIYIAGYSLLNWTTMTMDTYAAKLNNNGILLWNKFLDEDGYDMALGVALGPGGNIYFTGHSWPSSATPFTEMMYAFVFALDSNGILQWNTFIGGSSSEMDMANAIATDSAGDIYIAGSQFVSSVNSKGFVAKIMVAPPAITSFTPTSGGTGTRVIITGTNLTGATSVKFGGTAATNFTVNSNTQITAIAGDGATGRITVITPIGTATSAANFTFTVPNNLVSTTPHGSSMPGITATAPQSPVSLPTVSVRSASLSATTVAPGTLITVTADVVNTGTVNGTRKVTVYVNGEIETTQGVTLDSGNTSQLTFNVSRSEPGTYSVYVDGASAGSFTVDQFADPNTILYISGALLVFAFIVGALFILRRRQPVQ